MDAKLGISSYENMLRTCWWKYWDPQLTWWKWCIIC